MDILWFIPLHGDSRYLGTSKGARTVDYEYVSQVAKAADSLGYQGVLLPTGKSCEDAWITASSLIPVTKKLKFLVAVRPGLMSPTLAARMAASFDRFSGGRLLVNVVAGGDPDELRGDGVFLDHQQRYEQTDEFLKIWRDLMKGKKVNTDGDYYRIEEGEILFPPLQKPYPPLYFGGSSPVALQVAAEHVNVYLTWGEPPKEVSKKIAEVRKLAEEQGRKVTFGIRLHIIVRETAEEAWAAANQLIAYVDDHMVAEAKQIMSRYDSVGQRRMLELHNGDRNNLEISPNLWSGIGLVRGGAGTALVGDPQTVAARIQEYADLGIESFILSGYPHLEESYRVAELLFPLLPVNPQRGGEGVEQVKADGEIIANRTFLKI